MTRQFVILDNSQSYILGNDIFEAPSWVDARDIFIGVAFEHQMVLRKGYPPEKIVRSQMDAHKRHEIYFTVDNVEIKRWRLREYEGGFRGWVHNLIAAVS